MNRPSRLSPLIIAFLLLLSPVLFAACESEEPNVGTTVEDIVEAEDDPVYDDGLLGARTIYDEADSYLGQTVTVSGEVSEIYGPNAMTIGEDLWGEDLLVVVPPSATVSGATPTGDAVSGFLDLNPEYVVQVTGTVGRYVLAEVERDYDLDLTADLETDIEEREAMIVAQSIEVMTEEAAEAIDERMDNDGDMDMDESM